MRLKLRHISTLLRVKNIRPAHSGKTGHEELGNHDVVLSAGTMADQQFSGLVPDHDDPDVAVVRVKSQVPRLGLGLGNVGAVAVLHDNAPAVTDDIAQAVVEHPIDKTGTVQTEGAVRAGGGAAGGPGPDRPAGRPALTARRRW